ncbi:hypothetical protein PT974_07341 [Cladobotryum mycophilum]|uniref:Uncharacterized protein n=1 Tax=Cladobotryum mycophilum TaxID=491253 RepID=A0ABR0SP88_9HYPO
MGAEGGSVQAQCHELLHELKTLRERENAVLERLVVLMAGSPVETTHTKALDPPIQTKEIGDANIEPVRGDAKDRPSLTSMETLLNEAYGVSSKNFREHLPDSIRSRVKMRIANDAIHHTMLLSVEPDKLNEIFGDVPTDAEYELSEICTSSGDWKYWKVLSNLGGYVWASPGHLPDYMPTWELRKHGKQWYHIDDTAYDFPFAKPWLTDEVSVEIEVPYSLVPPGIQWIALPDAGSGIPDATWDAIHQSLGTLFSAPPDARLQLAFEAEELRQMYATNKHYRYLDRISDFHQKLAKEGGEFRVCDFSDVGSRNGAVSYGSQTMTRSEKAAWEEAPAYRRAAWPALNNEGGGFIVPTTTVNIHKNSYGNWKVKTYSRVEMPPRPWCRFILLRGLSDIIGPDAKSEEVEAISDLLINDADRAKQTMVKSMFNSHVFCRRYRSSNTFLTSWKTLNITWHQIVPNFSTVKSRTSSWKSGPLHNNELQYIEQRAFTVLYLPHNTDMLSERRTHLSDGNKYWTIMVLAPSSSNWVDHYKPSRHSIAIVHIIARGLGEAADAWDQVHPQFSSLIAESSPILDPRRHDRLMFDDDTFSRSRQYFWAMNSLEIFKVQVEDAILEWTHFWTTTGSSIKQLAHDEGADEDLESVLGKVNENIRRLEERKAQFETIMAKTLTLRDGLFNASAVIESRASTHLGENVQLLTYVSIFYLPLSFCVSMWSVNESYSRVYLAIITILVAATTYLLVANLKNISRVFASMYNRLRDRILCSMQNHEAWEGMAKKFNGFRPRRESEKPSEWNLLLYAALQVGARIWWPFYSILHKLVFIPMSLWYFVDDLRRQGSAEPELSA